MMIWKFLVGERRETDVRVESFDVAGKVRWWKCAVL